MVKFKEDGNGYDVLFSKGGGVIGSIWKCYGIGWVWTPSEELSTAFISSAELRQIAGKIDGLTRSNK